MNWLMKAGDHSCACVAENHKCGKIYIEHTMKKLWGHEWSLLFRTPDKPFHFQSIFYFINGDYKGRRFHCHYYTASTLNSCVSLKVADWQQTMPNIQKQDTKTCIICNSLEDDRIWYTLWIQPMCPFFVHAQLINHVGWEEINSREPHRSGYENVLNKNDLVHLNKTSLGVLLSWYITAVCLSQFNLNKFGKVVFIPEYIWFKHILQSLMPVGFL